MAALGYRGGQHQGNAHDNLADALNEVRVQFEELAAEAKRKIEAHEDLGFLSQRVDKLIDHHHSLVGYELLLLRNDLIFNTLTGAPLLACMYQTRHE